MLDFEKFLPAHRIVLSDSCRNGQRKACGWQRRASRRSLVFTQGANAGQDWICHGVTGDGSRGFQPTEKRPAIDCVAERRLKRVGPVGGVFSRRAATKIAGER